MLMQALAQHHRVLYVEYAFTWKDVWQGILGQNRPHKRILGLEPRLRKVEKNLHVLTLPPILPINGLAPGNLYNRLAEFNGKLVKPALKRAIRSLGMERPVLINAFQPFLGNALVGALDEQLRLYYCYDQIGAARYLKKHGPTQEARYLKQVDALITSSAPLLEEKGEGVAHTFLIQNGVNTDLFKQAWPQSLSHMPTRPVLGYVGSIDDRMDESLMLQLLDSWPEAEVLLVGRFSQVDACQALRAHPRVRATGAQPPEALPDYMAQMSVGLIPFVRNNFTKHIYPLKINEYLAAGIPVVSTNFGDLSDFTEVATIAQDKADFLMGCRAAIASDSLPKRRERTEFAAQNSWAGRAEQLVEVIQELLAPKVIEADPVNQ